MVAAKIKVGKKAPALTLPNERGRKVSLKDHLGKWVVVYFYPKDHTPGCTTEACEFRTGQKQFQKLGARVIGVSADSPESHKKFITKNRLKFPLLSDCNHKAMARYGAWGRKKVFGKTMQGPIRSTVLVDPDGRVAYHWPKVRPKGHAKEVRQKLAELKKAG